MSSRSTWGSKRKRGNNSWELRYPVSGKVKRETFHGSAKDADRRLSELRIRHEGLQADMTLSQFWDNTFHDEIKQRLAESTVNGYEKVYRVDISPKFGDELLRDISARKIQSWLTPMTAGKARHAKAVLSAMLSRAFALELIDDNPAQRRFVMPTGKAKGQRSKDVFTLDEMMKVFEESKGEIWEAAFILAAFGGASREEAVSPMLDEIMFLDDWGIIPISRGVQRLYGEVKINPRPKNRFRERDLIIPPPPSLRLKEIVKAGKERGDKWLTDDGTGYPLCPNMVADTYKRWFQYRELRYVPFGNLRNSYGTVMEGLGIDGMMVSMMLGQSQPSTYYRHYFRPSTEDKIDIIKKVMGNYGQFGE